MADTSYRLNSFFTGIGGFDLGFEKVGITPIYHSEIDNFCNSVIKKHWPNVPNDKDINKIHADNIPEAEIWSGGFPCQDVSVARGSNGRKGLKGEQSGLFFQLLELISQKLPQVVLIENVVGLLNSHKGKDFLIVIKSLLDLGYGIAWRVVNTRYFGAPQSRPRVYICAWYNNVDYAAYSLFEPCGGKKPDKERAGFISPTKCDITGAIVPEVAFCLAATSGRHTGTDWSRSYVAYTDTARRLTPRECEALQGFSVDWTIPEKEFKAPNGRIDSLRYKALGNAVSVPVVEWIADRIKPGLSGNAPKLQGLSQTIFSEKDRRVDKLKSASNELSGKTSRIQDLNDLNRESERGKIRWRSGGCAVSNLCVDGKVSPSPSNPIETKFVDIIEKNAVNQRYFLSPNAAEGILRRVDSQKRKLFDPLKNALRNIGIRKVGEK